MKNNDPPRPDALELGHLDVGARHQTDNGCAGHAHHMSAHGECQSQYRKRGRVDPLGERHGFVDVRDRREKSVGNCKDRHQDVGDKKVGYRYAAQRDHRYRAIKQRVTVQRGQHPEDQ